MLHGIRAPGHSFQLCQRLVLAKIELRVPLTNDLGCRQFIALNVRACSCFRGLPCKLVVVSTRGGWLLLAWHAAAANLRPCMHVEACGSRGLCTPSRLWK